MSLISLKQLAHAVRIVMRWPRGNFSARKRLVIQCTYGNVGVEVHAKRSARSGSYSGSGIKNLSEDMKHSIGHCQDMMHRFLWWGSLGLPAFSVYLCEKMGEDEFQRRLNSVVVRRELFNQSK